MRMRASRDHASLGSMAGADRPRGSDRLHPRPWPWADRPRVLLEHDDPLAAAKAASRLANRGYAVGICHGPRLGAACPLVEGEDCIAAEGARVIVFAGARDGVRADVLAALRRRFPETSLLVFDELPDSLPTLVGDALRGSERPPRPERGPSRL